MKPLFTVHPGEFLVGDRVNRRLGRKFDVWVPTKDVGIDLLVTRKRRQGEAIGMQVKFSRTFDIGEEFAQDVIATSWFALDPAKVRRSQADLWVFVILTPKHEEHYVLIPTRELRQRVPRGSGKKWNLYLWVFRKRKCYQVRDLRREETLDTRSRGVRDGRRDFSEWLENWGQLDRLASRAR